MTATVVVRRIRATPGRPAALAWEVIANLLAASGSNARRELDLVAGISSSLIAAEAMRNSPAVVHGVGPRLRLYCVYDEDSLTSEESSEELLAWCPTDGDWAMSLPCPDDDLAWVQEALASLTARITARGWDEPVPADEAVHQVKDSGIHTREIDVEAYWRP